MESTAEYTRKSIFMDHPLVLTDVWAKASASTDFKAGSVLMVSEGVVSLATDAMTADTLLGVLPGDTTVGTEDTRITVVRHGHASLAQLVLASGATPSKVAAVLAAAGIYAD